MKNSRLFKSGIFTLKNLLKDPANAILLYIKIVYAALNTMEELANIPSKGNLSKIPYRDKNSPKKLRVSGTPQLPKESMKNKIENIGIIWLIPL